MSEGSAASITSGVSSRSAARTNSAPPQPSRSSLTLFSCSLAFGPPLGAAFPRRSSLAPQSRQRRGPSALSRASRAPGFFDQEDRDVVAHGVGQAAGGAGAHELAGVLVDA